MQNIPAFAFMKSKENVCREENPSSSSESDMELADDWVLSYEPVELVSQINHLRLVSYGIASACWCKIARAHFTSVCF